MHLKENEHLVKVFRHHGTPFFIREFKVAIASLPFYFLAFVFEGFLSNLGGIATYSLISAIFALLIAVDSVLYFMDRLIVTNKRIVYIEWHSLFHRKENEANLDDIQDIETVEKGVFSFFRIFDYGLFKVETASSKTTIEFTDAADPEGIKHFVYSLGGKHNRMHSGITNSLDDQKTAKTGQPTSAGGVRESEPADFSALRR